MTGSDFRKPRNVTGFGDTKGVFFLRKMSRKGARGIRSMFPPTKAPRVRVSNNVNLAVPLSMCLSSHVSLLQQGNRCNWIYHRNRERAHLYLYAPAAVRPLTIQQSLTDQHDVREKFIFQSLQTPLMEAAGSNRCIYYSRVKCKSSAVRPTPAYPTAFFRMPTYPSGSRVTMLETNDRCS